MSEADLKACRKWHATNAKGLGVSLFVTSDQMWNENCKLRDLGGHSITTWKIMGRGVSGKSMVGHVTKVR